MKEPCTEKHCGWTAVFGVYLHLINSTVPFYRPAALASSVGAFLLQSPLDTFIYYLILCYKLQAVPTRLYTPRGLECYRFVHLGILTSWNSVCPIVGAW